MYTFEFVSYYRLSVAPTMQCLAFIVLFNNFNLLICIAVMCGQKTMKFNVFSVVMLSLISEKYSSQEAAGDTKTLIWSKCFSII